MAKKNVSFTYEDEKEVISLKTDAVKVGMNVSDYLKALVKEKRESQGNTIPDISNITITPPKEDTKVKENKSKENKGDDNMATEEGFDEKYDRRRTHELTKEMRDDLKKFPALCEGVECLKTEFQTFKKEIVKNKPQKCLSCHQEGAIEGKPFCAECGKPINWKDEDE